MARSYCTLSLLSSSVAFQGRCVTRAIFPRYAHAKQFVIVLSFLFGLSLSVPVLAGVPFYMHNGKDYTSSPRIAARRYVEFLWNGHWRGMAAAAASMVLATAELPPLALLLNLLVVFGLWALRNMRIEMEYLLAVGNGSSVPGLLEATHGLAYEAVGLRYAQHGESRGGETTTTTTTSSDGDESSNADPLSFGSLLAEPNWKHQTMHFLVVVIMCLLLSRQKDKLMRQNFVVLQVCEMKQHRPTVITGRLHALGPNCFTLGPF